MIALSPAAIAALLLLAGFAVGVLYVVRYVFSGEVERLERQEGLRDTEPQEEVSPADVEGKRCSACGEWIDDAFEADICPDCDLPYHLYCESDHRCNQEWVAEEE